MAEPDLVALLESIGGLDCIGLLEDGWSESMRTLPEHLPFLGEAEIRFAREYCSLADATEAALIECAARVERHPALRRLAWHAYRSLYEYEGRPAFERWPSLRNVLGEGSTAGEQGGAGCFFLLIGLAMARRVRAAHERLGIPRNVSRDTCQQIACFAKNYSAGTGGQLGLFPKQLFWLRHYTDARLFRIGRFEYMVKALGNHLHLFRHVGSGRCLALAPADAFYDQEGYALRPNEEQDGAWRAEFAIDDSQAIGSPIDPAGRVVRQAVALDLRMWRRILKPGDMVLDLHIPTGERMPLEACADSLLQAPAFFASFFPHEPAAAFWCSSWIFGPQLEQILPSHSNLVRFLRQAYLCPVPCDESSLWFIYLRDDVERSRAPRENSLQAAVADYLAAGGRWREAGMVYPFDDLGMFGREPFRVGWAEEARRLFGSDAGAAGAPLA